MGTADKIHLNSFDSLFGEPEVEDNNVQAEAKREVQEIPITDLVTFHNHTFRVDESADDFKDLVESIKQNGKILNPVLVRPYKGKYEIISGHRRTAAGKAAGLITIPCLIREFSDDEATVVMVDSNIQRTNLLPSEKANSYKAKYDALSNMKSWGDGRSSELLAENVSDSAATIKRYISLTKLINPILDDVDTGLIKTSVAYDLTSLSAEEQGILYDFLLDYGHKISGKQGKLLKENAGSLTREKIEEIFVVESKPATDIVIKKTRLKEYFSDEYTISDMENIIYKLLTDWKNRQDGFGTDNDQEVNEND